MCRNTQCTFLSSHPALPSSLLKSHSWNYLSIIKPGKKSKMALWPMLTLTDGCWKRLMTRWKPLIWQEWKTASWYQSPFLLLSLFFFFSCLLLSCFPFSPIPFLQSLKTRAFCCWAALALLETSTFHLTQGNCALCVQEHLAHLPSAGNTHDRTSQHTQLLLHACTLLHMRKALRHTWMHRCLHKTLIHWNQQTDPHVDKT